MSQDPIIKNSYPGDAASTGAGPASSAAPQPSPSAGAPQPQPPHGGGPTVSPAPGYGAAGGASGAVPGGVPGAVPPGYAGGYQTGGPSYTYPTAPAVGAPLPGAVPGVKRKTAPIVVLVIGVVVVIASVIGFVISAVVVSDTGLTLKTVPVGTPTTVEVSASELVTLSTDSPSVQCAVTDPSGAQVGLEGHDAEAAGSDEAGIVLGSFQASAAGSYTVSCTGAQGGEVTLTGVTVDGSTIAGGVGILATLCLGFIGTVMALAGLVWLVVRVSHNRKAQQAYSQAYPPAYPQAW